MLFFDLRVFVLCFLILHVISVSRFDSFVYFVVSCVPVDRGFSLKTGKVCNSSLIFIYFSSINSMFDSFI